MKTLLALAAACVLAAGFSSCTPAQEATTPSNLPLDGGIGDGVNPPGGGL